jgi:hypothetical protein
MGSDLSAPLLQVIRKLQQTPTKGEASRIKRRFANATDAVAVVCDVSPSMLDTIGSYDLRKWDQLRIALADVYLGFPGIHVIAFGSYVRKIAALAELPAGGALGGSTNMAAAIQAAAELKPRKTIIISDGLPDSTTLAQQEAEAMTGAISAIYCGPEGHPGAEFLYGLARMSGGRGVVWEGREALTGVVRNLLAAPAAAQQ